MNISAPASTLRRQLSLTGASSPIRPESSTISTACDDIELLHNRLNAINDNIPIKPFTAILRQQLHRHQRYNHSASTTNDYAGQRRAELAAIAGAEEIAGQYGITIAMEQMTTPRPGRLKLHNISDSNYHREAPSETLKTFCEPMKTTEHPSVLINSHLMAKKVLDHFCGSKALLAGTPEIHLKSKMFKKLQPGVFVLKFLSPSSIRTAEALLQLYGAHPSPYALMAQAYGVRKTIEHRTDIDNSILLAKLKGENDNSISGRLRALPENHGAATLASTAASLIDTLTTVLEQNIATSQRQNPILANGLDALHNIADSLPALSRDHSKFSSGYQALIEELQVCLSATTPYTLKDFHQAAAPLLAIQHLPASVPVPEVKLVSSGMAAIAVGLEAASLISGCPDVEIAVSKSHGKAPPYFEIELLHGGKLTGSAKTTTLFATLGHNIPGHDAC